MGAKEDYIAQTKREAADLKKLLSTPVADVKPSPAVMAANAKLCERTIRASMKDPESARVGSAGRIGACRQST